MAAFLLLLSHCPVQIIKAGDSELVRLSEPLNDLVSPDPAINCPFDQPGLLSWHSPSTWPGGVVPTGGDVSIPENSKVLLAQSPAATTFGLITVPSTSELIIGSNNTGITLHVTGMQVLGALRAGAETCRLQTPVTITLHGSRPPFASTTVRDGAPALGIPHTHT